MSSSTERAPLRAVLDSNVWLDWLVFRDPGVAPLRAAHARGALEVLIDAPCAAELERVLAYALGKWTLDAAQRAACMAEALRVARRFEGAPGEAEKRALARCRDGDDQKFLELALAARADALVTKDLELLRLARRRLPFRIVKPGQLFAGRAE